MTKRILTIIGTRPEAIKLCPLVQELQSRPEAFESVVCSTGQHKEMLQQVFDTFNVTADFDLALICLLYTSPSPRDRQKSRMPSSA